MSETIVERLRRKARERRRQVVEFDGESYEVRAPTVAMVDAVTADEKGAVVSMLAGCVFAPGTEERVFTPESATEVDFGLAALLRAAIMKLANGAVEAARKNSVATPNAS